MRNGREHGAKDVQSGSEEVIQLGDGGLPGNSRSDGMVGPMPAGRRQDEQFGTVPVGLPDTPRKKGKCKRNILATIETDSRRGPEFDPVAGEQWPTLQECLAAVLTAKGQARAGGEVKTVAVGYNYRTTLVMPEEGVQVSVVHNALSTAWDALEHVLCLEPVPWVECSEFATRRAKQRGKKKEGNKLDATP